MRYYSVILLDDEELIVQSLRNLIPWSDWNCYIRASANDGQKGRELLEHASPDILIADIKMPGFSGLELAEYCAAHCPDCQVILVSAYAEFDFARKALKAGTVDYLVKPIDRQDLIAAVSKAIRAIEKREEAKRQMEQEKAHLEHVRTLAEDSILFNMARYGTAGIKGEMLRSAESRARQAGVVIMTEFLNLTRAYTSVMAQGQSFYGMELLREGYHPAFGSADETVVMICPLRQRQDYATARNRLIDTLRAIAAKAPKETGINVVCVSGVFRNEEELQQSYRQCLALSHQAFFREASAVVTEETGRNEESPGPETAVFVQALKNGQESVVRLFLDTWRRRLLRLRDKQSAMTKIRELQRETTLCASRMGMKTDGLWLHRYESENFSARYQVLTAGAEAVCTYASRTANPVDRCAMYMEDHYAEHDLSLETATEAVQVSAGYLSRAFKKKYGVNFTEYLTTIRVDHAKKLLESSNRKVYEIADQIGYEDAHYFSQVFKKRVGMSPLEYRQQYREGQKIQPKGSKSTLFL